MEKESLNRLIWEIFFFFIRVFRFTTIYLSSFLPLHLFQPLPFFIVVYCCLCRSPRPELVFQTSFSFWRPLCQFFWTFLSFWSCWGLWLQSGFLFPQWLLNPYTFQVQTVIVPDLHHCFNFFDFTMFFLTWFSESLPSPEFMEPSGWTVQDSEDYPLFI